MVAEVNVLPVSNKSLVIPTQELLLTTDILSKDNKNISVEKFWKAI